MSSNKDYKWSKNWARAAGGVKRGRKGNRGRRREERERDRERERDIQGDDEVHLPGRQWG